MLGQKSAKDPLQILVLCSGFTRFLTQHYFPPIDSDVLEFLFFCEIFTRLGGIVTGQHTRKSDSSDQYSCQESPEENYFVAELTFACMP